MENKLPIGTRFYRYDSVKTYEYGYMNPKPIAVKRKIILNEYQLWHETETSYFIGFGDYSIENLNTKGVTIKVSKGEKRKYAYLTKDEALQAFINRKKKKIAKLKKSLQDNKEMLTLAKNLLE